MIFFLGQGSQKKEPQELAPATEVGCGLLKISTFSKKRARTLTIFFLYFPKFFLAILTRPNRQVWVSSEWGQQAPEKISEFLDKRAKSYACFTEGMSSYGYR